MTIDELQSTLFTHDQKLNKPGNTEEEQVLKVEQSSYGRRREKLYPKGEDEELLLMAHTAEDEQEMMVMANTDEVQKAGKNGVWFINSGCSNHMCKDLEMFTTLDHKFTHSVKLRNNSKMQVSGKGSVKLELRD
ncbi:hypothetical protein LIER_40767 [Lithospermum erythrorhizon]|uniref:Retrovirus-related Pol polyprotein from transposon TNT 1-94-like beta-barrel domain-containing protein n=1 Tax=Lithospermum erythrorhizon TaxID=34254 RepID=A0AAV3R2D4_LITER